MRIFAVIFLSRDRRLRAGWRFLLGFLALMIAELASGFVAGAVARGNRIAFVFLQEPLCLLFVLLIFSLLLRVADRIDGDRLAAQGLPRSGPWLRQFIDGNLLGAAMVTVCVVAIRMLGSLTFTLDLSLHSALAVLLVFLLLLAGAAKEEVEFRGYPFQRLVEGGGRRWGPMLGIGFFSLLFGLVHWGNPSRTVFSTANTALIGVVLAIAYLRTRALWVPIGIHLGWNFTLGVLYGLPVSGISAFSVFVHGHPQGPVWLTGGDYGIESSGVGTVVILLSVIPVLLICRRPAGGLETVTDWQRKPAAAVDATGDRGIQI